MNSIFVPVEYQSEIGVTFDGEYLTALKARHNFEVGRRYSLGLEGKGRAEGILEDFSEGNHGRAIFKLVGGVEALVRSDVRLVVGISRPQTVKKVLHVAASFGISEVVFIRSERAEKSYFQSAVLLPRAIRDELVLGLEQGWDYELPKVKIVERFKPFVVDELASVCGRKIILSTRTKLGIRARVEGQESLILAVGPEAGWSEFEEELLVSAGFLPLSLGRRMLRVEVALAVGLGHLSL